MKYFVQIGDTSHEVTIDGGTVFIDGELVRARLESVPGTPVQLLSIGNEVHRVLARRGDRRGRYDLSLGGHRFDVEALNERERAIRDLSGPGARVSGPVHLLAPMPGLIVRIAVSAGDEVRPGQGLVVMEAMKMENELRATATATVKRVVVSAGSAVEKGAMLLEMESGNDT
jgi:acetyl/propionyl-CoA carboxylase alpha subunit